MIALLLFASATQVPLLDFAFDRWRATPRMRIEDAYKWIFHATQGGEHAVPDDEGPRRWLEREWRTLGLPRKGEPEVVPLTPDGRLIRVNLRPYRARGGDCEMLLAVFVASARAFHADRGEFVREWQALGRRLRGSPLRYLTYPEWVRLDRSTRLKGYPAMEHSETYERLYRPAYRVVLGDRWVFGQPPAGRSTIKSNGPDGIPTEPSGPLSPGGATPLLRAAPSVRPGRAYRPGPSGRRLRR